MLTPVQARPEGTWGLPNVASEGTKIASAIIAAAVIVVAGVVGYLEYTKLQIAQAAEAASRELHESAAALQADLVKRQQEAAAAERKAQQSRWLRRPERCIGGKVMVPEPSGKVGWITQLERGRPVACSGVDTDRPYRIQPRPLTNQ